MKKVILLGPKYSKSGEVGGIVVSFELMCKEFENANIETKIIDLNKGNYPHKALAPFLIITQVIYLIPNTKALVLNGTANDFKYLAPLIVFLSKIFSRKIVLRKFAGSFIQEYEKSNLIVKKMINYALKASTANFFQTKYLIKYFKTFNKNTFWLPTSRPKPSLQRDNRPYEKRFVYLGHIREEKGIYDLIELSKKIDSSYTIDLYGALIEKELEILLEHSSLNYHGELKPKEVIPMLSKYDILILPSYREGYPGVIIEALSVSLPIVATNLESITEIVDNSCGKLFEPKNIAKLETIVSSFNKVNYPKFSKNAKKQFDFFDSKLITQKVINLLN